MNGQTPRFALTLISALFSSLSLAAAPPAIGIEDGEGDHEHHGKERVHHEISTRSHEAQDLFDQGLNYAYGFNHQAAADSFEQAITKDPGCGMCYWGLAYALGPNINAPYDVANQPRVLAAMARARTLLPTLSAVEQAYIEAMSARYADPAPADRSSLNEAWAKEMRRVAKRFPDDLDASVIFAESLMDTTPWDYWKPNGDAKKATREFIDALESVLRREPLHPGANHFLIHSVEKGRPDEGLPSAGRLLANPQATSHLTHMAAHIYIRVGQYDKAAIANERAIAADDAYYADNPREGMYAMLYAPHNTHFLWAAYTLDGRKSLAIATAEKLADGVDRGAMTQSGLEFLQHFWSTPLFAYARFGEWSKIDSFPEPEADLPYARAIWRYAHGLSAARQGRYGEAQADLEALKRAAIDPKIADLPAGNNTMGAILAVGSAALAGELATAQGQLDDALRELARGVALQDAFVYDEPPPWHYPLRQSLGEVQLQAGDAAAAERTYRADLEEFPNNGWSLFGLTQSLLAQGKTSEAAKTKQRFETAWKRSDVELNASRF